MQKDDLKTVKLMIGLYCRKKHGSKKGELCKDCEELCRYVEERRKKCPFCDDKPFCSNCRIHCYKPAMKERIKEVMRFSGPRMMFYSPRVAWAHVFETMALKRREAKANGKRK